jgi:adenylate cyclase
MHEALNLAYEFAHPFTLAYSQGYAALVYQFGRATLLAQDYAEVVMTLAAEQGFPFWTA